MNNGAADAYMGGRKGIGLGTILKAAGVGAGVGALIGSSQDEFFQWNAMQSVINTETLLGIGLIPFSDILQHHFYSPTKIGEIVSRNTSDAVSEIASPEIRSITREIDSGY